MRIGIAATVRDRRLKLRVCDPAGAGVGKNWDGANGEGFGLRYVRERLRRYYGADASVTLNGSPTGTVVTIDVPLVQPRRAT